MLKIREQVTHTPKNRHGESVYEGIGSEGSIRYDREAAVFFLENGEGRQDFPFAAEEDFTGLYREWGQALQTGTSGLLPPRKRACAWRNLPGPRQTLSLSVVRRLCRPWGKFKTKQRGGRFEAVLGSGQGENVEARGIPRGFRGES